MKSSSSLFRSVTVLSGTFLITSLLTTSSAQAADTVYVCTRRASKGATQTYIAPMKNGAPMCNNRKHIGPTPLLDPADFTVTGATGATGAQGVQGEKGEQGDIGPQGPQGETGPAGPQGSQGIQGVKGDTGAKGETGATGAKGDTGVQGEKGDIGATGAKGDTGSTGEKGDKGDVGPNGEKGDTGVAGEKGDKGDKGEKGDKGDVGAKGEKGATGERGFRGEKGERGEDGKNGKDGEDGILDPSECIVLSANSGAASTNETATLNCDAFDGKDNHNLFLLTYASSISPTSATLKNQNSSLGAVAGAFAESVTVSTNASSGNAHVITVTAVCCPTKSEHWHHHDD